MSSDHNNPIANAIDFVSHGQKLTTNGMIENPFSITQTGQGTNPADSSNLALSGFSLQSDMLTSAYFNSEVGDLRETLAAYQIKVEKNKNGCKRRAIFLGGMNHRDGCSKVCVDVNVGNYPEYVLDHPSCVLFMVPTSPILSINTSKMRMKLRCGAPTGMSSSKGCFLTWPKT